MSGRIPMTQTPDLSILLSHFLRQVESYHIHTPTRSPLALHYDERTRSLIEYPWWVCSFSGSFTVLTYLVSFARPINPDTKQRVPPSELEAFRRTNRFRGPSCLCAFLDGGDYTEARIGIVESIERSGERSQLHGEYVAVCAKQRCGYYCG
jgi:hypothetical protein